MQYLNIPVDEQVLACVQRGLYLIRSGDERYAVFLRGPTDEGFQQRLQVEVVGRKKEAAEALLTELAIRRARNIYRGRVLSFERATQGMNYQIRLRRLPSIEQHQIILPTGLLERVERHAVHFAQHGRRLLAAGRHLKRGILFHGRPGTGKTLTVMYLATQMRDRYCVSFCRIRIWAAVTDLSDGPDAATRAGRSGRCRLDLRRSQPSRVRITVVVRIAESDGRPL